LAFHVQAAQTFLASLHGNSLAHIELQNGDSRNALERLKAESAENRAASADTRQALARIEQVLADMVQEVKQGSREPSLTSGDGWNVWTELRRDLQVEGFSSDVVKLYKMEIRSYLVRLMNSAGLQGDLVIGEEDDAEKDKPRDLWLIRATRIQL
jgi:hypothetical protein